MQSESFLKKDVPEYKDEYGFRNFAILSQYRVRKYRWNSLLFQLEESEILKTFDTVIKEMCSTYICTHLSLSLFSSRRCNRKVHFFSTLKAIVFKNIPRFSPTSYSPRYLHIFLSIVQNVAATQPSLFDRAGVGLCFVFYFISKPFFK